MAKHIFNKLVRDKIPDIIRADGKHPVTRILDEKEYLEALAKKLVEELEEFKAAYAVEELADIQEVVDALQKTLGITKSEFRRVQQLKKQKRGGLDKKIYLEWVENE